MAPIKPLEVAKPSITVLGGIVLVAAVLHLARSVLIPVALALLLTFILTPTVMGLQRRGFSRAAAVLSVMFAALVCIGVGLTALSLQLHQLVSDLPSHKGNIKNKIHSLKGQGPGPLDRLVQMVDEITAEAKPKNPEKGISIPVTIKDQKPTGSDMLTELAKPLVNVIASAGLVIALTMTMLFRREDLRDRLIRLVGQGQLTSTTRAIDEATRRISRYLVVQVTINAGFGLLLGLGLATLGVPYWVMWGILAMVLRFIPYIGTWMSGILPLLVSIAVSDGWFQPFAVVAFTVVLGVFTNNVLEPLWVSRSTGVSPVALVVAAAFWTWLWGPVGLILSTPISVCLGVLGRYVPQLQFLDVLLGTDPALDPQHGYYQRLLARDDLEASTLAETYLDDHSVEELCDRVLLPTLVRTREERGLGRLGDEDVTFIVEETAALLDTVLAPLNGVDSSAEDLPLVLGCPAKDEVDELALRLFRQISGKVCRMKILGHQLVAAEVLEQVDRETPAAILISAVPPGGLAKIRYLCKRLRSEYPNLQIVVAYWGLLSNEKKFQDQLQTLGLIRTGMAMASIRQQLALALLLAPTPTVDQLNQDQKAIDHSPRCS